jgi:hypothetical protein
VGEIHVGRRGTRAKTHLAGALFLAARKKSAVLVFLTTISSVGATGRMMHPIRISALDEPQCPDANMARSVKPARTVYRTA